MAGARRAHSCSVLGTPAGLGNLAELGTLAAAAGAEADLPAAVTRVQPTILAAIPQYDMGDSWQSPSFPKQHSLRHDIHTLRKCIEDARLAASMTAGCGGPAICKAV